MQAHISPNMRDVCPNTIEAQNNSFLDSDLPGERTQSSFRQNTTLT